MPLVYSVNQAAANGAEVMFKLKEHLKVQGWTVPRSSDGTTFNASGDQITLAGSGAGGMNNNAAWFVVRDPSGAGGKSFLFQRNDQSVSYGWYNAFSITAGFTGGGANTAPTATDEKKVSGTSKSVFGDMFATLDTAMKCHFAADTSAPYTWYSMAFTTGGSTYRHFMAMDTLISGTYSASDTAPLVVLMSTGNKPFYPDNSGFYAQNHATSDLGGCWGYYKYALSGEAFVNYGQCVPNHQQAALPSNLGTNPYESKDDLFPVVYGRSTPNASYKGISTLFKYTGSLRANLDTFTVSTARDRIVIRGISLPWDGTVPVL